MKRYSLHHVLCLVLLSLPGFIRAQGTAFSYQGRLNDAGAPANGLYDFTFSLFGVESGGAALAGPTSHNAVSVSAGVFNVTLDFGANAFTGPARWLEIQVRKSGVGALVALTPRSALLPTPYSVFAAGAGNVPSGSIAPDKLAAANAPTAGRVLTYDGTRFNWASPTTAGGIWSLNGAHTYYKTGNVGIGLTDPAHKLTVRTPGSDYGIEHTDGNVRLSTYLGGSTGGGWLGTISNHKLSFFVNDGTASLTVDTTGNVGIGTPAPTSRLEIIGQDALQITGFQPLITMTDTSSGNARTRLQSVAGGLNLFAESYLSGANGFAYLRLDNNGNVGIGSAQPVGKLEVVAQDALRLIGYQPFLTLFDSNAGYARSRIQGVNGDIVLEPESYISGSNPNAAVVIANSGNVSVRTLTIRGGADLAEPFELSATDIPKGSVVVIDEKNPGKLKLSTAAYDTRVAGIVSGANGVNPGISLQQDGVLDRGQNVALSGRVYVQADATTGTIKPGDLLTTSATPGHAMKVGDHAKAQGAILGKAMTGLKEGKGMVLVLVTLQ